MIRRILASIVALVLLICPGWAADSAPLLSVLIVDGQNNHPWQATTPALKGILEHGGPFQVAVATVPPPGKDGESIGGFAPHFHDYDVVLLNYNGRSWPKKTQESFVDYVKSGGGFVVFHAANNAFPDWPAYNEIIGLGGWGRRNEKDGPYVRWREGKFVRDSSPGRGGSHGIRHEFAIDNRAPHHPIMKGIPARWLHSEDELYDRLRGPAKNLEVLATAYSDPATKGTGEHEPVLMTVRYGNGRVFHTVLGDNLKALFNVGFQVTLLRGTEWAATGNVTLAVPAYYPGVDKVTSTDPGTPYRKDAHGWRPLFDGKYLAGWSQVNGTAEYKVVAGEIRGTTATGSPNSFLSTVDEFGDFELRFEVRLDDPRLNSGVQIRSHQYERETMLEVGTRTYTAPAGRVYGYQVEIAASRHGSLKGEIYGGAGFIYDEARRGWLSSDSDRRDPQKRKLFQNGSWNQYFVRCIGDRLQVWVNGVPVGDVRDSMTSHGHIMLQVHSIPEDQGPWSVRWRNILIREIQ